MKNQLRIKVRSTMKKLLKMCCKKKVITEVTTVYTPLSISTILYHTAETSFAYLQDWLSAISAQSSGWKVLNKFQNTDGMFVGAFSFRNTTPHYIKIVSFDKFVGFLRFSEYFDVQLEPNSVKVVELPNPRTIDRMGADNTLGYLVEVYSDDTYTTRVPITEGLVEVLIIGVNQ